jgi:hypothetical protein
VIDIAVVEPPKPVIEHKPSMSNEEWERYCNAIAEGKFDASSCDGYARTRQFSPDGSNRWLKTFYD